MYGNSFQNGFFFQVWDSRVNPQKNIIYKQLFRKNPSSLKNQFDKQVKSYIYQLSAQSKITLPADDQKQLSLHQRYLVIQLYIPLGSQWSMQIGITDLSTQKKRINLTTTPGKQQIKYFSLRYPLEQSPIQKGTWSFLAIDIYSFCKAFKGTIFRSLDHIVINGNCKLRRIFTMKEWLELQIPKNYWLPAQIQQTLQMIEYRQPFNAYIINSSLNVNQSSTSVQNYYGKLAESKISQTPHNLQKIVKSNRNNNQINYQGSLKLNKQKQKFGNQYEQSQNIFKLPEVSILSSHNKLKDSGILKSSKLSSKIQDAISTQFGLLAKSNRSLTKGDLIIQKSKIRLNSLQQKEEEILTRMKSQQSKLNEHQKLQNKKSRILNSQLFEISQNKQKQKKKQSKIVHKNQFQIQQNASNNNNLVGTHKIKIEKHFEQDQIYDRNNQYSQSSYESSSYRKQNIETPEHYFKNVPDQATLVKISQNNNKYNLEKDQIQQGSYKKRNNKEQQSKHSQKTQLKQEIIQEDVWSDNAQQKKTPQTPIQEIIVSEIQKKQIARSKVTHLKGSKGIGKTIISKQNNRQIIVHSLQGDLESKDKNSKQLQLIYDQMVGCYYHPSTNTYYEIANQ